MSLQQDLHRAHVERRKRMAINAVLDRGIDLKRKAVQTIQPNKAVQTIQPIEEPYNLINFGLMRLVRQAETLAAGRHSVIMPSIAGATIRRIIGAVADFYQMTPILVMSRQQRPRVVLARQISIYIASIFTKYSVVELGRRFERDHSTISHSINKIERLLETDPRLRDEIQLIKMRLLEV